MKSILLIILALMPLVGYSQDEDSIRCNSNEITFEIMTWDREGNEERNCPEKDDYPTGGSAFVQLNGHDVMFYSNGRSRAYCQRGKEKPAVATFIGCAMKGWVNKSGANLVSLSISNVSDETYLNNTEKLYLNKSMVLLEWSRQGKGASQVFTGSREINLSAFVLTVDNQSAAKVLSFGKLLDRLVNLLQINDSDLQKWRDLLASFLDLDALKIDLNSLPENLPQWFKDLIKNIQLGYDDAKKVNSEVRLEIEKELSTNQTKIQESLASMGGRLSETELDEALKLDQDTLDDEQMKQREHGYLSQFQEKIDRNAREEFLQLIFNWEEESKTSTEMAIELNSTQPGYYVAFLSSQERILAFVRKFVDENYFFRDVAVSEGFKQLIDNGLKVKNPSLARKMKDFINLRYKKSNAGDKALAHLHSISESYVQSSDSETDRASLTLIDHVLNFLESAKDFVECELKTKAAGLYATFYEVYEGKSFCKDEPLDNIDRTISFVDFSSTLSSNLGIKLGMGVGAAIALKKVYGVVAPLFRKIPTDQLSKIGKYFVEIGSKLKFSSPAAMIENFKNFSIKVKKWDVPEDELSDFAEFVGEVGHGKADELLESAKKSVSEGSQFLYDNYHRGTGPSKSQSLIRHIAKHGKGRSAVKYVQDSMDFFQKNKHLAQPYTLMDGTAGLVIKTKGVDALGKVVKVGGFWTADGKLVTFWD